MGLESWGSSKARATKADGLIIGDSANRTGWIHWRTRLTVISSAWFPMRNMPSWMGHWSLPSQSPVIHSSRVSGNHEGGTIACSTSTALVSGGYVGHVRRSRNSIPFPLYPCKTRFKGMPLELTLNHDSPQRSRYAQARHYPAETVIRFS